MGLRNAIKAGGWGGGGESQHIRSLYLIWFDGEESEVHTGVPQ